MKQFIILVIMTIFVNTTAHGCFFSLEELHELGNSWLGLRDEPIEICITGEERAYIISIFTPHELKRLNSILNKKINDDSLTYNENDPNETYAFEARPQWYAIEVYNRFIKIINRLRLERSKGHRIDLGL